MRAISIVPAMIAALFPILLLLATDGGAAANGGGGGGKEKPTRSVVITADEEKKRDADGFAAIAQLHRLMDDDQSGSIDRNESADFLTGDLNVGGSADRKNRERIFHRGDDEQISVDDLWESWFQSDARNWDTKRLVEWLTVSVRLPQYAPAFEKAHATGTILPRMALADHLFLKSKLGIKNFVHCQRIQMKALDLVLFGHYDVESSWIKDLCIAVMAGVLALVLFFFRQHKKNSKRNEEEMKGVLSRLKDMEKDLESRMDAETTDHQHQQRRESISTADAEHIEFLKSQLMEAERRLEMSGYENSVSLALQPLLRRTFDIETAHLGQQKLECLAEMREAKEFVDKMRRKQTSIINSLKLATGSSSCTEDIDSKIFSLKARMEKIKYTTEECNQRWADIETLCGFSITGPFAESPLPYPSHQHYQTQQRNAAAYYYGGGGATDGGTSSPYPIGDCTGTVDVSGARKHPIGMLNGGDHQNQQDALYYDHSTEHKIVVFVAGGNNNNNNNEENVASGAGKAPASSTPYAGRGGTATTGTGTMGSSSEASSSVASSPKVSSVIATTAAATGFQQQQQKPSVGNSGGGSAAKRLRQLFQRKPSINKGNSGSNKNSGGSQ